jgi:hypothetical protein
MDTSITVEVAAKALCRRKAADKRAAKNLVTAAKADGRHRLVVMTHPRNFTQV